MRALFNYFETHTGIAAWISALISVLALIGVVIEYERQKRRDRLQLAQEMIEQLSTDEMLVFATTTLDWGSAIVIVPELWRAIIGSAAITWKLDDIRDAMRPNITEETQKSPTRLLYRHAFVRLFDHLERMGDLLRTGAIDVRDLRPLTWLIKELRSWQYALPKEREDFFLSALTAWYPNGVPKSLIDRIADRFPNEIGPH